MYKARLVALGNHQTRDTFEKIKSPTATTRKLPSPKITLK